MTIESAEIAMCRRSFYNDEMRGSRATFFFIIALPLLLLGACAGNETANGNRDGSQNVSRKENANAETVPQEYAEELAKIVKLNLPPEETTYTETNLNNGKRLVAVLKYSTENAAQIQAQAEKYKPAEPSDIEAENWFPAELIAQSQLTGDESLKGATYAANDYLQTPYVNGKLTRVNNTDYFILELTTF